MLEVVYAIFKTHANLCLRPHQQVAKGQGMRQVEISKAPFSLQSFHAPVLISGMTQHFLSERRLQPVLAPSVDDDTGLSSIRLCNSKQSSSRLNSSSVLQLIHRHFLVRNISHKPASQLLNHA
eukprot:5163763-Amphidinium_carterae.1